MAVVRRPVSAAPAAAPAPAPAARPAAVAPRAAAPAPAARPAPAAAAPAGRTAPTQRAAAPTPPPAAPPRRGPVGGAGGAASLEQRLAAMKQRWEAAKVASAKDNFRDTNPNVDNGDYPTQLQKVEIRDYEGVPGIVNFGFVIAEGDKTGEELNYPRFFDTDDKLEWLQRDLRRLGVPVDEFDITQLPTICKQLEEQMPGVKINVKWNGDYQNIRILKLIELGDAGTEVVAEEPETPVGEVGEAASEEPVGEEPATAEGEQPATNFNIGDEIQWKDEKNKTHTGLVMQIYTDGSIDARDAATKKMVEQLTIETNAIVPMAQVG